MQDKLKQLNNASWKKISELSAGMKIAVPDIEGGFSWDEVASITPIGREEVWDIEVEDVHNFIGNDIFAHNTYANGGPAVQADVVAYDPSGNIVKAGPADQPAGVMIGFGENGSVSYEFNGRASVKVSAENGPVKVGDRLTVSATMPGFAMKMTEAGQSIGLALAEFGSTASGSVPAFVDLSYWAPSADAIAGSANDGTASGSPQVVVSSSGSPTGILVALADAVLTRVQNIWASGDIIAQGIKKTYFSLAETVQSQFGDMSFDMGTMVSNWLTRDIAVSPNIPDSERAIFQSNNVQAADQSKVDLAENGNYLATYGVDSTRGEIQLTGSSEISGGEARIYFDFSFTSIISETAPIRVIITPTTAVQGQLYIDAKTPYGFIVKSINGPGNASFDWLVIARRKGFEGTDVFGSTSSSSFSSPSDSGSKVTPSPSTTPTPLPSVTPTPEPTPIPSESPSPEPTLSPTSSPTTTPTTESAPEPTPSPSSSDDSSESTVTPSPSTTPESTSTPEPTPTPSESPSPSPNPEVSESPAQ